MAKGVLFKTISNMPPTSPHADAFEKLTATARKVGSGVELTFTLTFKKASIIESPGPVKQHSFWPFVEGTMDIEFINPDINLDQLDGADSPAKFAISVDWPDGKIGGANALIAQKEEQEEDELG